MSAPQVVVVVDPLTTGAVVALEAKLKGYDLIRVWSAEVGEEIRCHVPSVAESLEYVASVEEASTIAGTAEQVKQAAAGREIVACICGAECGVTLADKLSFELGVLSNGVFPGGDRRNKSVQSTAVRKSGLRAVREAVGKTWAEVEAFVAQEPLPIVVKPVESAGSEGVKLCMSREEVKDHFNLLMTSQRMIGAQGAAVICQEFLKGKEYVIDHVSRDGVHKLMMVWVYDKRAVNGAAFVYYGMLPVDVNSPEAQQLVPYVRGVLDALKLNNGPSHAEVMMTADGPCLVEMNCRAHGGEGSWVPLARMMTGGYSQTDATINAFVDPSAFDRIPMMPPSPYQASGQEVILVSLYSGTVRSMPAYDKIKQLPSFISLETGITVGSRIELTVDLFTAAGSVILANRDAAQMEADVAFIRNLEKEGLFEFDEELDPVQSGPSPDTIIPDGKRRTSSMDTLARRRSSMDQRPASSVTVREATAATAAAFATGLLLGVLLCRRR